MGRKAASLFGAAMALCLTGVAIEAQQTAAGPGPVPVTVDDGFTIATVGDLILAHSLEHYMAEPAFAALTKVVRDADAATGNMEAHIIDGRSFKGSNGGGFAAEPNAAAWLKSMGFDIVARPNNHVGEVGPEGVVETGRHLEAAGVQYSGYGDTYAAARAARFYTSTKGRIGMVAASPHGNPIARPASGEWPGLAGMSGLGVTQIMNVPEKDWGLVQGLRAMFPNGTSYRANSANTATRVIAFGHDFRKAPAGVTAPSYSYLMNQRDLQDILAAIREGKERSDFITFAIHAHHFRDVKGGYRGPNVAETESMDTNSSIADYLPVLAHAVIDNGADLFQGTGVHVLRGIEIYKNRPIFYGLGEFMKMDRVIGLAGQRAAATPAPAGGGGEEGGVGDAPFPAKYESVVAVSRFEGGQLSEVRLYPVSTRYAATRVADRGVPEMAPPEIAQRILTRLQQLSSPLGTTIAIEGNVGIIRLPVRASATGRSR